MATSKALNISSSHSLKFGNGNGMVMGTLFTPFPSSTTKFCVTIIGSIPVATVSNHWLSPMYTHEKISAPPL